MSHPLAHMFLNDAARVRGTVFAVLAVVALLWVVFPMIHFSQMCSAEGTSSEWILDFAEDERSGEQESEKSEKDDEEKTHNAGQLDAERDARAALGCVVRLKVALEEGPILKEFERPPRA